MRSSIRSGLETSVGAAPILINRQRRSEAAGDTASQCAPGNAARRSPKVGLCPPCACAQQLAHEESSSTPAQISRTSRSNDESENMAQSCCSAGGALIGSALSSAKPAFSEFEREPP